MPKRAQHLQSRGSELHFRNGWVKAAMPAPPCSSFSIARSRYPVGGAAHPEGIPSSRAKDREAVWRCKL
eukprot:2084371-Pyramimonas_sp.AAC.1